jgi:hypothetical protein
METHKPSIMSRMLLSLSLLALLAGITSGDAGGAVGN